MTKEKPVVDRGRILANAGWLYLDQMVRAVAVLVAFGAMARSLGPEQFGWLSYAIAFPGVFLPLAMMGLDYVVVRDLVRHPGERDQILGTTLSLKIGAALAALGASMLFSRLLPIANEAKPLVLVTSLSLAFQPLLALDFYFQSQVAAKYSAGARMLACLVANGLRLWLAWRGAPVSAFAWLFAAEAAMYGGSLVVAWRVRGGGRLNLWPAGGRAIARRMLTAALPLFWADVAIAGYLRIDQLLLRHLAGAEELGRYAAAFRLADAAEFFALALITSYFPRIVALHAGGADVFQAEVGRFFRRMTWFAVAVAVAVSATAPWICGLVLGEEFGGAWPVLVLLTWANVFVTQIAVRGKWFLMEGLQWWSLACFAIGAAAHLGVVVWAAPRWGALGAAGSFVLSQFLVAVVAPALFSRSRKAAGLALRSFVPGRA